MQGAKLIRKEALKKNALLGLYQNYLHKKRLKKIAYEIEYNCQIRMVTNSFIKWITKFNRNQSYRRKLYLASDKWVMSTMSKAFDGLKRYYQEKCQYKTRVR